MLKKLSTGDEDGTKQNIIFAISLKIGYSFSFTLKKKAMVNVSLIIHYQLMKKKKHHIFLARLQLTDFDREAWVAYQTMNLKCLECRILAIYKIIFIQKNFKRLCKIILLNKKLFKLRLLLF